ncbi:MAG TPA: hypothetical protein VM327_01475 [Candidatus Thermoplasmatota archaeon]|nr:hypothetical protein [Candidatus Thermoplasmatota archaeon]
MGIVAGLLAAWLGYNMGGWLMAVPLALVGAAIGTSARYAAIRQKYIWDAQFAAVAQKHGWTMETDLKDGPQGLLPGFIPFSRGHGSVAHRCLQGTKEGMRFWVMDAAYTTGSGKSTQVHPVCAVLFEAPFSLTLSIQGETAGHKLVDALGGADIDFEDDRFSRQFWVQSPDRRTAYDVLHPKTLQFLQDLGADWTWHWVGAKVMMARHGKLQPSDCEALITQAGVFVALLPRHLVSDRRAAVRASPFSAI